MSNETLMRTSRVLPFSPSQIYGAFSSADLLAQWWGPDGFSNSFSVFEFHEGGRWNFNMHGPDGIIYPNHNIFETLVPNEKIVIRHDCPPYFTLTVGLKSVSGGGTEMSWEQVFDDAKTAQAVKAIVVPANEQNLDRLTRVLTHSAISNQN